MHFEDTRLHDLTILKPKWITESIYKIINSNKMAEQKGIVSSKIIEDCLGPNYNGNDISFIIELMKKFHLCFTINDEEIMIPGLLDVNEPSDIVIETPSLKIIIQYDFLPSSLVSRLIHKFNKYIFEKKVWRTGALLFNKELKTKALLKADLLNNNIYIDFYGENTRDYLTILLYSIKEANADYHDLKAVECLPIPGTANKTVSLRYILSLEKQSKLVFQLGLDDDSAKDFYLNDFLQDIRFDIKNLPNLVKEMIRIGDERIDKQRLKDALLTTSISNDQLSGIINSANSQPKECKMLNILVISANPLDTTHITIDEEIKMIDSIIRKRMDEEIRAIDSKLSEHTNVKYNFIQKLAVTVDELQEYFLQYKPNILHFSGHGNRTGEIILARNKSEHSDPISNDAICDLLALFSDTLKCVILNSCYSKILAEKISEKIDFVIGSSRELSDEEAISFSGSFYLALSYGQTVQRAYELGLNKLKLSKIKSKVDNKILIHVKDGADASSFNFFDE